MKYTYDGYNYFIRFDMGERLSEALQAFALETSIQGCWMNGVGAAREIVIGFYHLGAKEYKLRTIAQMMEVVSLSGNVAVDEAGKLALHMHGVFSDEDYQTVGGHVKDLIVGGTLELFVHRSYKPLRRTLDAATGLHILDV